MRARFPSPRDLQDRFELRLREAMPAATLDLGHTPLPLPYADSSVVAAAALRVLEHAADPVALVGEAHRVLRPRGELLVHTVLGAHFQHSFQVQVLLEHAGFHVESVERFNVLIQPVVDRLLAAVTRPDGTRGASGRAIAGVLLRLSGFGAPIDRVGGWIGIGGSCVVRARKA